MLLPILVVRELRVRILRSIVLWLPRSHCFRGTNIDGAVGVLYRLPLSIIITNI